MNNPRSMKVATGLTSVEFNNLSNLFCDAWYSHELSRKLTLAGVERSRKFGGGRRSILTKATQIAASKSGLNTKVENQDLDIF